MGIKSYPCWVYGHGLFIQYTRTGKPMVFLNRVQSSAIVILFWEFIIKLITLLLRFLFWWNSECFGVGMDFWNRFRYIFHGFRFVTSKPNRFVTVVISNLTGKSKVAFYASCRCRQPHADHSPPLGYRCLLQTIHQKATRGGIDCTVGFTEPSVCYIIMCWPVGWKIDIAYTLGFSRVSLTCLIIIILCHV